MKRFALAILLGASVLGGCASSHANMDCPLSELSREEIIKIVDQEVERRGGSRPPERSTKIKIRREQCDYLYYEVGIPKRPGDYLYVRISPTGEIKTFLPGA